jgi:hypothetical protein
MKSLRVVRVGIVVLGIFGTLEGGVGYGRAQQTPAPAQVSGSNQVVADAPVKATDDQRPTTPPAPANDRQKKLAADTDKLLALATDLKKQVDKTNKDILSVDVVKKAEEIEKLARSMKNTK